MRCIMPKAFAGCKCFTDSTFNLNRNIIAIVVDFPHKVYYFHKLPFSPAIISARWRTLADAPQGVSASLCQFEHMVAELSIVADRLDLHQILQGLAHRRAVGSPDP